MRMSDPRRVLVLLPSCLLALVICGIRPVTAAEARMHPAYEPESPCLFDRLEKLFRGAKTSESGHWSDRVAALAVDGSHDDPGEHWGCEGAPVWLTVELSRPQTLNTIRLWTFWNGNRAYQYVIEGSLDKTHWRALADRRNNTVPATALGETFSFPAVEVQYVRTTILGNSESRTGGHIVEIEGYHVPAAMAAEAEACRRTWQAAPSGLSGAFGSKDVRYPREVGRFQRGEHRHAPEKLHHLR